MKTFKIEDMKVSFDSKVDGTYIVNVEINGKEFHVNCQTYLNNSYQETYGLSCINVSGSDIYDSGLQKYLLDEYSIADYDEHFNSIYDKITSCAEAHRPENTVERILNDSDIVYKKEKSLFGAFGPADIKHYKYIGSDGSIIVTSEDVSQPKAENMLTGKKYFNNENTFKEWINKIYDGDHYGDCSVSYRAWKDICKIDDYNL